VVVVVVAIVVLAVVEVIHEMITTWIGDCLRTGKPSQTITNTTVNSTFHLSSVGRLITILSGWVMAGHVHLCQVTLCDPIWLVMLHSSEVGFYKRYLTIQCYCLGCSCCCWNRSIKPNHRGNTGVVSGFHSLGHTVAYTRGLYSL